MDEDEFDELDEDEFDDKDIDIVEEEVEVNLQEIILDADNIEFGEQLDKITETIQVSTKEKIYDIQEQTSDLLDDLLSVIPTTERNIKVINNVNLMVERFKELRENFSTFNNQGFFSEIKYKNNNYKPILHKLKHKSIKLNKTNNTKTT